MGELLIHQDQMEIRRTNDMLCDTEAPLIEKEERWQHRTAPGGRPLSARTACTKLPHVSS